MFLQTRVARVAERASVLHLPPAQGLRVGGVLSTSVASFPPSAAHALRLSWWLGEDVGGGRIGTYAPFTRQLKAAKGLPTDRVILLDTGRLYTSIKVELKNREYVFKSDVPYLKDLIERYGKRIMGPGPAGRAAFRAAVKAYLVENLSRIWLRGE